MQGKGLWASYIGLLSCSLMISSCKGMVSDPKAMIEDRKKAVVTIKANSSIGSGFLVHPDGLIVTNNHVVDGATTIEVLLSSGETRLATLVKSGISTLDIAFLAIDGSNYQYVPWADSSKCEVGEEVYAIGAPLTLTNTVTRGIVSNCTRDIKGISLIQTDAAINSGSSGGPLLNVHGEALGILTMKIADKGIEGLNFAIASRVAQEFYENKLTNLENALRKEYESEQKKIQSANQAAPLGSGPAWRFIEVDPQLGSIYWNEASLVRVGSRSTLWLRFNVEGMREVAQMKNGKRLSYIIALMEYECSTRVARSSEIRFVYADNTMDTEGSATSWGNVAPSGLSVSLYNLACK